MKRLNYLQVHKNKSAKFRTVSRRQRRGLTLVMRSIAGVSFFVRLSTEAAQVIRRAKITQEAAAIKDLEMAVERLSSLRYQGTGIIPRPSFPSGSMAIVGDCNLKEVVVSHAGYINEILSPRRRYPIGSAAGDIQEITLRFAEEYQQLIAERKCLEAAEDFGDRFNKIIERMREIDRELPRFNPRSAFGNYPAPQTERNFVTFAQDNDQL